MAEEEEIVETDPYCTSDRFAAKNGIKAIEVGEDYSVCIMPIDETCLNGISIPMGGCYFTLGDFSFGVASHYIKNNMVTMNSQIDFIASKLIKTYNRPIERKKCIKSTTINKLDGGIRDG